MTVVRWHRAAWAAGALAALAWGAGCGGAAVSEPSAASSTSGGAAPPPSSSGGTTAAGASGTAPMAGGSDTTGTGGHSSAQIETLESRISQGQQNLSSAGNACGDVCRASSDICAAAREICEITGDPEGRPPSNPRCDHARTACVGATRQRDSACPVCPAQ